MSEEKAIWEILIPRKWNNGNVVTLTHHTEWDELVRDVAGGLTIFAPTVKGVWVSDSGLVFVDSTIPVRISCTRKQINKILDITAVHYQQEAVMAYKVSEEVIIKKNPDANLEL